MTLGDFLAAAALQPLCYVALGYSPSLSEIHSAQMKPRSGVGMAAREGRVMEVAHGQDDRVQAGRRGGGMALSERRSPLLPECPKGGG